MNFLTRLRSLETDTKYLITFLVITVLLLMTACASQPAGAPKQTPAQIATQVCPPLTQTLSSLQLLILPPKTLVALGTASEVVNTVCAIGSGVTAVNLQTLLSTALPALVTAVKASTLSPDEQNKIILDISVVQIILSGVVAAGGPAPTPPAPPASAASSA